MGQDRLGRVWDIIETVGVGMMTTRYQRGLRARPLEARRDRDAGVILFVTDVRGAKDDEIAAHPEAGLCFIDQKQKAYLSLTGRAEVRRDPERARAIWKSTDDAWWSGPDDPNVRVLCFIPETAELWDGPASAAVAAYEFAKARATGEEPDPARTARPRWRCAIIPRSPAGALATAGTASRVRPGFREGLKPGYGGCPIGAASRRQ